MFEHIAGSNDTKREAIMDCYIGMIKGNGCTSLREGRKRKDIVGKKMCNTNSIYNKEENTKIRGILNFLPICFSYLIIKIVSRNHNPIGFDVQKTGINHNKNRSGTHFEYNNRHSKEGIVFVNDNTYIIKINKMMMKK